MELSGRVLALETEGLRVLATLHCVLEQDIFAKYWFKPGRRILA